MAIPAKHTTPFLSAHTSFLSGPIWKNEIDKKQSPTNMDLSINCPVWLPSSVQKWPVAVWNQTEVLPESASIGIHTRKEKPSAPGHMHRYSVSRRKCTIEASLSSSRIVSKLQYLLTNSLTCSVDGNFIKDTRRLQTENVDTFPQGESFIVLRTCRLRITCPLSPLTSSHYLPSPINLRNKNMLISLCFKPFWVS